MSTSYRGTTWGKIEIEETALRLKTLDETPKSILGIEFQSINNATVNKNDIIIESGAEIENDEDCMCEIRFHVEVPKEENDMEDEVENSNAQKEDEEGDEDRKQKVSLAQNIYNTILERAKIGSFGGESLVTLNEVNLAVPRGKYTIDFYQKNLRFHGQTYNFLIEYKNIMKGFLLPMENESQVSMILQLHKDRPVYQGQTVYRYIVIQVKKDVDVDIKTRIKDKDK
jgi:structure-specific recognition protein 1